MARKGTLQRGGEDGLGTRGEGSRVGPRGAAIPLLFVDTRTRNPHMHTHEDAPRRRARSRDPREGLSLWSAGGVAHRHPTPVLSGMAVSCCPPGFNLPRFPSSRMQTKKFLKSLLLLLLLFLFLFSFLFLGGRELEFLPLDPGRVETSQYTYIQFFPGSWDGEKYLALIFSELAPFPILCP